MSRLSTLKPAAATGIVAEIFNGIKKAAGMIPNCYATIGTHSPTGLRALLGLDEVIKNSGLNEPEIEAVRLMVSVHAECEYCIAAHSYLASFTGLSEVAVAGIKMGGRSENRKLDALLDFVRTLLNSKGTLPTTALENLRDAGYTDGNIVETLLIIASTTFMNLINRVNDTAIDFPHPLSASQVC